MQFQSYAREQQKVIESLVQSELSAFLRGLLDVRTSGGTLWIAGNGGSASTGSHAVVDFIKTSQNPNHASIRSQNLSDAVALTTAFSNDISFETSLGNSLKSQARSSDSLLVLSVSGTSPNLIYASQVAKQLGLVTFCIVGEKGKNMAEIMDNAILIPSADYQIVENLQLMLIHWFTKCLQSDK